jgi:transcription-repair coupling factor (superfamily II helicase)
MIRDIDSRIAALPVMTALADTFGGHAERAPADRTVLRVAPLLAAARVPVIAALASSQSRPLLYIVYNTDSALRATEDLRQWLAPERVLLYPASDAMPYEYMAPDEHILGQRLRVLHALSALRQDPDNTTGAPVIVAPIKALLQPTLTPHDLEHATTSLHLNGWVSQDSLLRRWLGMGYRSVPMVERPGDLARRGGIVDIWPATDDLPLRIEWFGDEVDSLRRFDAGNQRSEQRLETVSIGPPCEIAFWRHQQAFEHAAQLDSSGLRPEAHTEWQHALERLEQGDLFEGWSFFAPFFQLPAEDPAAADTAAQACSLCCHLPPGAPVLWSDMILLAQVVDEFQQQAEGQRASLVDTGELPPDFPRSYLAWAELLAQTCTLALVDMSNNEDPPMPESLAEFPHETFLLHSTQGSEPLFLPAELFGGQLRRLVSDIVSRLHAGDDVAVVSPQVARIQELVQEAQARQGRPEHSGHLLAVHGTLDEGWRLPEARLTLYTDTEIFGWRQRQPQAERQSRKQRSVEERAAFLRGLKPGDYVVHIEHGIALYDGLLRRTVGGVEREYLNLRYAKGDRLYVPVDQVDRVARYVGAGDAEPQLTRLGTQEWERAKRKARAAVRDLADDLLAIYARRQAHTGYSFSADNTWQRDLENAFPYIETADQLRALHDIKQDMEAPQPMDRLMCGDVGFGKTEVALRAAFKAVQDSKQVALLVPTTVLAQQHYTTFSQRMASFPVSVEMLSRFRSPKEQEAIVQHLSRGTIDIVIGTHRLLSKDIRFKDLGLLIVDEEQRFGVRHKERLKQIRSEVDVLTLTATPIPRTLHMTLAGIRDMSIIDTPPEERMPIKTYVVPHEETLIRDAIRRELDRGGQVYFLHNRVYNIYHVAARLRHLVPEADIGVAHGQLDERQLEKTMLDFFQGVHDVLVCTTIIENGLDVPNANTMIIDDATTYGLSQLYQLRGRVGRSANRAYAYLLYKQDKPITPEAHQRLQAIQEATELGSGFRIAMRDLEIRGAGNLLGAEQSGHIAAVGFDLYSRLLEQAVTQLKQRTDDQVARNGVPAAAQSAQASRTAARDVVVNEKVLVSPLVTLDLPLTAYLPEDYIGDEMVRLAMYQRMVEAQTPEEVRTLRQELRDRFGDMPDPAAHLLTWLHIKALALNAGVRSVTTSDEEFTVQLPIINAQGRERLRRRFGRDHSVKVGPQFVRLNRRAMNGDDWIEKLTGVLEVLAADQVR